MINACHKLHEAAEVAADFRATTTAHRVAGIWVKTVEILF